MAILQETTISGSVTHKEGTVATAGTTLTLDLSTGSSFEVDMESFNNDIDTLTVLNKTDTNHNRSFLLQVTANTYPLPPIFTWASINNVKWPGGTAPTLNAGDKKIELEDNLGYLLQDDGRTGYDFVSLEGNIISERDKDIYSFTTWDNGTTWYARIIGQNY